MRVFGCQAHVHNESDKVGTRKRAPSTDLEPSVGIDLSKSMFAGTRKMVNYA